MQKPNNIKLLLATPAYGGQLTSPYVLKLLDTYTHVIKNQLVAQIDVHILSSESLISRARNRCARFALEHGYDKMLFIDSDISWEPEWLEMLLSSDYPIIGGTYPLKGFPIRLNLNVLTEEQRGVLGLARTQDAYVKYVETYADARGEVEVRHIPTGFMMIDTSVFVDLAERGFVEKYETLQDDGLYTHIFYDWFPVRVRNGEYESEDWAFCEIARSAGHRIGLQTKAVCTHTGTHHYAMGQHVVVGQQPKIP